MADVSQIKLPSGTTYDIKDATARANSGVTGVKGSAESLYRTGNVNVTAANVGAVAKTDELLTTNPFAPTSLRGPYISKIDNSLYAADKRWTVTVTNSSSPVRNLFDGNYESQLQIRDGKTSVITIDFSETSSGFFPGYAYGYYLISFYYACKPASVSARVYCNYASQGIGWHNISMSLVSDGSASQQVYRSEHQSYHQISQIEFTIVGDTTNNYGYTAVCQIEMHSDRPDSALNPFLSKYGAETLYYPLTAPKFIGALQGNADTATNATKVNNHTVNTDVPANAVFTDTTALGSMSGTLSLEHGGTGATSAAAARTNLGLGSAATASTASTVGNNSNLPTGAAVQTYVTGLGYEANQNAFSNVKVGSTTVAADTETDTLELAAGANITLTPDATNDKVTIAATDTTYESKAAASGGTAVSLVTTGEKYTWNNKTSNTGTVTSVATGTGLTGGPITTSGTVSLATVHSTAPGAKGDTVNQTPAFGGTFKVPSGTVDAYGRTTAFADHTVTIPSATFGRNAAGLVPASGSAVTDMVQILADDGNWYQLDGDIVNVTSSSGSETLTDFVQTTLPDMLDEKQDALVSGTNIKTINSQSILGSGNIQISGGGIVPDDYVIAHGTSGNWYYRKWNSGRIEAWGTLSVTQSKTTAVGQVHRTTWSATIPAAVGFTSAPTVNLSYNVDASVFFGLSGHATSATAISGYGFRYSASTSTSATGISIYCWGT